MPDVRAAVASFMSGAHRGLGATCALAAIRAYQRVLSPRKGFCCALRAVTGGDSCSAYGYRVIARCGLWTGLRLLRRRLDACARQHRLAGWLAGWRAIASSAGILRSWL
jgi:putative component of membrane protein insertase Oxa1/YidC/SpoIIIJ protein YidD